MRSHSNFAAYLLIFLGSYFLLADRGWIPSLAPLIADWWPLILVFIGVSKLLRRSLSEKAGTA
jgi:hypothetical protein